MVYSFSIKEYIGKIQMTDLGAFWIACGIALGLAIFGNCLEDGLETLAEAIKEIYDE